MAVQLGVCFLIEDHSVLCPRYVHDVDEFCGDEDNDDYSSDGSSYTDLSQIDSGEISRLDVENDIAEEFVDEIRSQNRICSTIEDYSNGELVFSEADLTL